MSVQKCGEVREPLRAGMSRTNTVADSSQIAEGTRLRNQSRPDWVAPMLATLSHSAFSRRGWLFEPKLDGVRCLASRSGEDIELLSRNQKRLNEKYPELVEAFRAQRSGAFVVDGEIVTFDGAVTSFAKLQQRMQLARPPEEVRRRIPVWFYAFDLLHWNGKDTRQLPLRDRKALLAEALSFQDPLRFTKHRETSGEPYFQEACRKGWEGIKAKDGESVYMSGRSADWLKFKCVNEQEFVIGGYTDPKGSRAGFGALLVGFYELGRLRFAGKVGTGYDAETLRSLRAKLRRLESEAPPFANNGLPRRDVHWVTPKLVAQVAFGEWTRDGKLRQPRFLGLRFDKAAKEVVRKK
jgi:bifunctional non-homologous end joining protein LigD